jgi:hypothetical protein
MAKAMRIKARIFRIVKYVRLDKKVLERSTRMAVKVLHRMKVRKKEKRNTKGRNTSSSRALIRNGDPISVQYT